MSNPERMTKILKSLGLPIPIFGVRRPEDECDVTSATEIRCADSSDVYHVIGHYMCDLHNDCGDEMADRIADAIGDLLRDRELLTARVQTLTNDIEILHRRETWR